MTINELCTNASKHGALAVPNGRVNIATKVNERDGTTRMQFKPSGVVCEIDVPLAAIQQQISS